MIVVIGFLTTPILFIYGMYDAYKSAEKINLDLARGFGPHSGRDG